MTCINRNYLYRVFVPQLKGNRPYGELTPRHDILLNEVTVFKCAWQKWGGVAWAGLVWHRLGTSGRLFWTWWWIFGFCTLKGISWLADGTVPFLGVLNAENYIFWATDTIDNKPNYCDETVKFKFMGEFIYKYVGLQIRPNRNDCYSIELDELGI